MDNSILKYNFINFLNYKMNKYGGGNYNLQKSQEELVKIRSKLDNVRRYVSKQKIFEPYKELIDQIDNTHKLFMDLSLNSDIVIKNDKNEILNKLSLMEQYINDVPDIELDINIGKKKKILPILDLKLPTMANIDISEIKKYEPIIEDNLDKKVNIDKILGSASIDMNPSLLKKKLSGPSPPNIVDFNNIKTDITPPKPKVTLKPKTIIEKPKMDINKIIIEIRNKNNFLKSQFSEIKIKDAVKNFSVAIESKEGDDEINIGNFEGSLDTPDIKLPLNTIKIGDIDYELDDNTNYITGDFISKKYYSEWYNKISNKIYKYQTMYGGNILESFQDYTKIEKDYQSSPLINDLKKVIREYNLLYVQFYYYQVFLIKFIQNVYYSKEYKITKFLTKELLEKYYSIITKMNTIISDPDKYINQETNESIKNINKVLYLKHYIIIKIIYYLLKYITEKWTVKKWEDTNKIQLFKEKIIGSKTQDEEVLLNQYYLQLNMFIPIMNKFNKN